MSRQNQIREKGQEKKPFWQRMAEERNAARIINEKRRKMRLERARQPKVDLTEIVLEIDGETCFLTASEAFLFNPNGHYFFDLAQGEVIYELLRDYTVVLSAGWDVVQSDAYASIKALAASGLLPGMWLYTGHKKALRYAWFTHFNKTLVMDLVAGTAELSIGGGMQMYAINKALWPSAPAETEITKLLAEKGYDFYITPAGDYQGLEIFLGISQDFDAFIIPRIQEAVGQYALKCTVKDKNQEVNI